MFTPDPKQREGNRILTIYRLKIVYEAVSENTSAYINEPSGVFNYMRDAFLDRPMQEALFVLPLNSKNRILGRYMATLGTVNSSLVHPREVFHPVIATSASSFILCHNHPSGDPAPSRSDINITGQIREASNVMDIRMLDHIIIGDPSADPLGKGYYSFSDAGLMNGELYPRNRTVSEVGLNGVWSNFCPPSNEDF